VRSKRSSEWGARHWTSRALQQFGEIAAHSRTGIIAAATAIGWGAVGAVTKFPTWWQTALYSTTASVTFVMVFVLQHTAARQTAAMQRKLDELVRAVAKADDGLIAIEEAVDEDLQALGDRAVETRESST
jgi:low affinity Fe/Cu permease